MQAPQSYQEAGSPASTGIMPPEPDTPRTAFLRHIITPEYPPQAGGVSDYTFLIAQGLVEEGETVHVWCPGAAPTQAEGVVAHPDFGRFSPADLRRVDEQLNRFPAPRHILMQWVPHGYGYRSMNLRFCWWLNRRVHRHGDRLQIMAHEAYLGFRADSLGQSAVAVVHRLMTALLMRAAERVWVSIPGWEACLRPYAFAKRVPFHWLPVPSNIPVVNDPIGIRAIRQRYVAGDGLLLGHFGTFGAITTTILEPLLMQLVSENINQIVLLMGLGSEEFRREMVHKEPRLETLLRATGPLESRDLSRHLSACDLLIQPYPDGVSGRRSSFMAGLSHGKAMVTTVGRLSEDYWKSSGAALFAPAGDIPTLLNLIRRLCGDPSERSRLQEAGRSLYQERFDVKHTIAALHSAMRTTED